MRPEFCELCGLEVPGGSLRYPLDALSLVELATCAAPACRAEALAAADACVAWRREYLRPRAAPDRIAVPRRLIALRIELQEALAGA